MWTFVTPPKPRNFFARNRILAESHRSVFGRKRNLPKHFKLLSSARSSNLLYGFPGVCLESLSSQKRGIKNKQLDGQGKARRKAARRRNFECKINLSSPNSSRSNGSTPTAQQWLAGSVSHWSQRHSHLTPPLQRTSSNIRIELTLLETRISGPHLCRW